jgi:hypothetical protein
VGSGSCPVGWTAVNQVAPESALSQPENCTLERVAPESAPSTQQMGISTGRNVVGLMPWAGSRLTVTEGGRRGPQIFVG